MMDEKKMQTAPNAEEVPNETLKQVTGGFPGVPTVPVNPIDDELREDV